MHAVALRVLRAAKRPNSRNACRIVAGVRHPLSQRHFHRTATLRQNPDDPAVAVPGEKGPENAESRNNVPIKVESEESGAEKGTQNVETINSQKVKSRTGAAGKPKKGLPPVVLPKWFWKNNVKLFGESESIHNLQLVYPDSPISSDGNPQLTTDMPLGLSKDEHSKAQPGVDHIPTNASPTQMFLEEVTKFLKPSGQEDLSSLIVEGSTQKPSKDGGPRVEDAASHVSKLVTNSLSIANDYTMLKEIRKEEPKSTNSRYHIHADVYKEISSSIQASLSLRPSKGVTEKNIPRPALVLHCPKDGGTFYLDAVVEKLAVEAGADLIRVCILLFYCHSIKSSNETLLQSLEITCINSSMNYLRYFLNSSRSAILSCYPKLSKANHS